MPLSVPSRPHQRLGTCFCSAQPLCPLLPPSLWWRSLPPTSPRRMWGASFQLVGSLEAWGQFGDLGSDLGLQMPCNPLACCPKGWVTSGG